MTTTPNPEPSNDEVIAYAKIVQNHEPTYAPVSIIELTYEHFHPEWDYMDPVPESFTKMIKEALWTKNLPRA